MKFRPLNDRVLVEAGETGVRRFRPTVGGVVGFTARMVWRMRCSSSATSPWTRTATR